MFKSGIAYVMINSAVEKVSERNFPTILEAFICHLLTVDIQDQPQNMPCGICVGLYGTG
jgi:hypothetical protein